LQLFKKGVQLYFFGETPYNELYAPKNYPGPP